MGKETVITARELPDDVVAAIKSGQKIEAIKLLRLATGLGLANAKVLIDAGARLHGIKHQHTSMMDSRDTGAGLLKLFLMLLLSYGAYVYFLN
jgi:ribosomal protein L7/L12